eukprot:jgi/Bigna1/60643/fgenesh1_kg.13_\
MGRCWLWLGSVFSPLQQPRKQVEVNLGRGGEDTEEHITQHLHHLQQHPLPPLPSSPDTMLKQGWFANMEFMCQSSNDDNPDDDDDDDDDDDGNDPFSTVQGHCSVCAQRKKKKKEKLQSSDDDDDDNLVSPFYIQKYINHYHDASGIMTLLHNPGDSKVEQKDKTRDGAMKLPNSWFNQNHVDPRPACDDHNLRNDCFHTMRCGTDRRLKTPMSADAYIPLELY